MPGLPCYLFELEVLDPDVFEPELFEPDLLSWLPLPLLLPVDEFDPLLVPVELAGAPELLVL